MGAAILAAFAFWEHWLSVHGRQPLVDFALFRSKAFISGVLLMTIGTIPMAGPLFIAPQYFQGILGLQAEGAGVRLLPLIAGMMIGAVPADRLAAKFDAKMTLVAGFLALASSTWMASYTGTTASSGFIAMWMVIIGIGSGMVMATAVSTALMELP